MKLYVSLLGFWLCTPGTVWADTSPPAIEPAPGPGQQELAVDLTCILPTNGPAVEHGFLMVRLYEYDPRVADRAATEIARVTMSGISHRPGAETLLRFPCAGKTPARKAYYLTAVVYPDETPGRAGLYFINGFQQVLVKDVRQELTVKLTPVAADEGPTN